MSRGLIGGVLFGLWLGGFMVAVAQLPPEVMVDRYLLRAERLMVDKNPKGAFDTMNRILALQEEHDLTLPEDFRIKYAQAALSAGQVQEAIGAINTYLLESGREGTFYGEALELLDDADQIQAWVETRRTCAGQSKGSECWMEIIGQPGCFLWNPNLRPGTTVTWTGECFGGRAQGKGMLKEVCKDGKQTSSTGDLQAGKKNWQTEALTTAPMSRERSMAAGARNSRPKVPTTPATPIPAPMSTGRDTEYGERTSRMEPTSKAPM